MIMTRQSGSKLNTWITLEDPELEWIPVLLAKDKENKLAWILLIMAWRLSAMSIKDMNSGGVDVIFGDKNCVPQICLSE